MNWVIVGASGQLARCLLYRIKTDVQVHALSRQDLDITDEVAVLNAIAPLAPSVIINCAAFTQVDLAEEDAELAYAVNERGVANLAKVANKINALLVHVSTDYVFAGDANKPYESDAIVGPNTVYGKSKLAGEQQLLKHAEQFVIVRTAWLFSEYGQNFMKTMLRLGCSHNELKVVNDQIGCPTYAGDLANFIIWLVESGQYRNTITHFAGDKPVSWAEFARVIFQQAYELGLIDNQPNVVGIASSEYAFKTPRPAYSVLASTLSPVSNDWHVSLNQVLKRIER